MSDSALSPSTRWRQERAERGRQNPELIPHGVGGYVDWLCRCPVCRAANRDRQQEQATARAARGRENPELIPHGTRGGYSNWGCRCKACTWANTTRHKRGYGLDASSDLDNPAMGDPS